MFIRPRTKTKFDNQLQCIHKIGELIEMRFKGAWKSWKKFPNDTKNLIFSEFENRMYQLRKSKKKPRWLGEEVFGDLNEIFIQDEFQKQSERNKKNRESDCDGQGFPLHVGGCVSHSEYIDRLMVKQGHEPSIAEAFMHLRSTVDSDGNVKWVNERARKTHEEYTNKLSQISSQNSNGEESLSTQDQIKIFTEVVWGPKKGIIYGLAGQPYHVMRGSSSSITSRWSSPMEWESKRTQLLNHIKDIQSSFEAKVEAAVEERVANMEARFEARVNENVRAQVDDIEARLMAKFASFENNMRGMSVTPQLPKSPSSNR